MMQTIEANWMAFALALLAALVVGWYLFSRASKAPPPREYKPDVLDQGASSVQRNQALIDAAPAAQITPAPFGGVLGGVAEAVAVGAQDVVEEAAAAPPPPPPSPPSEPEVPAPPPEPAPAPQPEIAPPAPEFEPDPGQPETEPMAPPDTPFEPYAAAADAPVTKPQEPAPEPPPAQPETGPQPGQAPTPEPPPAQPVGLNGGGAGDDLSRIKGLGPKLQALLPTLGLTTYAQIAALDEAGLAELDGQLGAFAGRPAKDNWVEQARFLAEGNLAGFEAQFGKV